MSAVAPRKKSPRAPSISLDEALDRALRAYAKERLHAAPIDVVAQNIGYKTANNGAALSTLASLRYYGLVERPRDGLLAVTKEVETYQFNPDAEQRRELLLGFLLTPPIFAELLALYSGALPSDANIRYELIQRGFSPQSAGATVAIFRRSVEFADFYALKPEAPPMKSAEESDEDLLEVERPQHSEDSSVPLRSPKTAQEQTIDRTFSTTAGNDDDRIPIRLPGGRRAWLTIPTPFFEADKLRLKAQIDLLLTDDENQQ